MLAAKLMPQYQEAAKERQKRKPADSVPANLPEQKLPPEIILDHFEADTPEDMAILFRQFDNTLPTRSASEQITSQLAAHPELYGVVSSHQAGRALAGIAYFLEAYQESPLTTFDDRLALVGVESHFLRWSINFRPRPLSHRRDRGGHVRHLSASP